MSRAANNPTASQHTPAVHSEQSSDDNPPMARILPSRLPNVAIIVGGVSGLRCASLLSQAGSQVTIFEARDRVGGRVHQVENGGYLIDTGSNWIHGTKGNPIMTLAEKTKTLLLDPPEDARVVDKNGRRRSLEESQMLSGEFWETILEAFKYSDENTATINPKASLAGWSQEKWSKKFSDPAKVDDLVNESKLWGQFVGSPIETQSLKFFFLEEGLDGANLFVAGTYKRILDEIVRIGLEKSKLRLSTEVRHIAYRSDDSDVPVKVQTADGDHHEFDEVVVTCPLGWLKLNTAAFSPPLPPRLSQAIDSIGYGALEKLYISFPSPFWLGKEKDLKSWSCFTNFHSPNYHPFPASRSSSSSWNQSILSLSHLPTGADHPTLLFYMTGDSGAYLTNQIKSHTPHSESYNVFLKSFAEPFYSLLPHYDPSAPKCQPTSFYLTTWQNDPHAGYGSYSTFRTGLTQGDKDIETMRDAGGLSDEGRGLWLAGEHTAPFVALGTTTGAWWSGEGVARRIAKRYGLTVPEDEFSREAKENASSDQGTVRQVDGVNGSA